MIPEGQVDDIILKLPAINPPSKNDANVVYYVSGYIARGVSSALKCSYCSNVLKHSDKAILPPIPDVEDIREFFMSLNRGGLCDPTDFVFDMCLCCWSTFSSIKSSPNISSILLTSPNSRYLFTEIMQKILIQEQLSFHPVCPKAHDLLQLIVSKFFNCLAKNWIEELNVDKGHSNLKKIKKLNG
jgi:hypothetical protein